MENVPVQQTGERRALQTLDSNWSLNTTRGMTKRAPITYDKENEDAVLDGIALGIYNYEEVLALTNHREPTPTATPNPAVDSDDEDVAAIMGHAVAAPTQALNERSLDFQEDRADEMLMEDMDEDLGEDAAEGEVEHDDGADDDADEQGEGAYFDPTSMGLKEINNLAHFGVSSHKPGNGVEELLSDDLDKYWQWVIRSLSVCF
jgi:anaphase-promoting complex subunit 10